MRHLLEFVKGKDISVKNETAFDRFVDAYCNIADDYGDAAEDFLEWLKHNGEVVTPNNMADYLQRNTVYFVIRKENYLSEFNDTMIMTHSLKKHPDVASSAGIYSVLRGGSSKKMAMYNSIRVESLVKDLQINDISKVYAISLDDPHNVELANRIIDAAIKYWDKGSIGDICKYRRIENI